MAKPMPLTVYGPVTPLSPSIRVTGVLPNADVQILDNGHMVGHAVAQSPSELLVPLTKQPRVGDSITAIQKTSQGTSEPSAQAIPVTDLPNPLPTPAILSALDTCMDDILADGLVPSAKALASIGGNPLDSSVPSQTQFWLAINTTPQIPSGSQAEVHREAQIGGATRVSPTVQSLPMPPLQLSDMLPPPNLGPLVQYGTLPEFLQVVPGARTTISNEGQSEFWVNPTDRLLHRRCRRCQPRFPRQFNTVPSVTTLNIDGGAGIHKCAESLSQRHRA